MINLLFFVVLTDSQPLRLEPIRLLPHFFEKGGTLWANVW
jgi:hypothetical protein